MPWLSLTDFSPRKHLLNRGGEAWILRMPAVNLCNSNLLNSFISNSLNLTQNPMRAMILQKNCPVFSNHVTFDSATHVVMCPESMARQSRTVPSVQEIRAKYSLVDACFILKKVLYLYLYLLWRNTLTHLWSGGSEWNTLAHECAQTLGSLWFFGHQEPSQRQRALNWIANSDAPETWGDDACAIHGASTSGRMQFENLARHSRCIWFSQAQSFS